MELDDRADVVRVVLSKVGVDLVVDRLEFAPSSSICSSVSRCSGLPLVDGEATPSLGWTVIARSSCVALGRCPRDHHMPLVELDVALGSVDAGADHLSRLAVHPPGAQVADLPASSRHMQVWHTPIRQP